MVQKYLTKPGGRFYVLYVDFQKAFDSLVHYNVFKSLINKGIKGNFIKVFISMYSKLQVRGKMEVMRSHFVVT